MHKISKTKLFHFLSFALNKILPHFSQSHFTKLIRLEYVRILVLLLHTLQYASNCQGCLIKQINCFLFNKETEEINSWLIR